jgi:tripartite-type tricarboxylate transporter receptor subunit TctC
MRLIAPVLMALALTGAAHGQDAWPSRQITLIAPYAAGGSTDLVGRVLAEGLKARLGQPVTVENRPGGNGVPGTREVVKANPDGYTLLIGALGAQVLPAVMAPNFPFDPLRDFVPVSLVAEWAPVMLVKKGLPPSSLREFIAYAKARPGALNFGTSGYGSTVHLVAEIMMRQAGIRMQHVPYKGGGQSMTDLLSGSLDVLFTSSPVAVGQAENPNVKILAVSASGGSNSCRACRLSPSRASRWSRPNGSESSGPPDCPTRSGRSSAPCWSTSSATATPRRSCATSGSSPSAKITWRSTRSSARR